MPFRLEYYLKCVFSFPVLPSRLTLLFVDKVSLCIVFLWLGVCPSAVSLIWPVASQGARLEKVSHFHKSWKGVCDLRIKINGYKVKIFKLSGSKTDSGYESVNSNIFSLLGSAK